MKRFSFGSTIVCIILCVVLLSNSFSVMAAESSQIVSSAEKVHREVSVCEEFISYYEKSVERTINAVVVDDVIDFNFAYSDDPTVLYQIDLPVGSYVKEKEALLTMASWEKICEDGFRFATGKIVAKSVAIQLAGAVRSNSYNNTFLDYFEEEVAAIYGPSGTVDWLAARLASESPWAYASIDEYFNIYISYADQMVSHTGMKLQAFASVIGVCWPVAGALLGLGFGEIVPPQTAVARYYCTAFYERIGSVLDTPYYVASHSITHLGLLDLETANVEFSEEIHHEAYSPNDVIFNSIDTLLEYTIDLYNN